MPSPIHERSAAALTSRRCAIVLSAVALFVLLARLPSYAEPLEWDMGMYMTIGRELLEGERLYADAWDMKPPAIFVTFAAMQSLAGDGFLSLYLLSAIAAIVTMLGVYHAASVAGRTAGLWAAAFWAAMCFDPVTGGDRPNTEVFINAAVAWAFALWIHADQAGDGRGWRRWVVIGLLFSAATLYKQVAIGPALFLALAEVWWPSKRDAGRTGACRRVGLVATVGFCVWTSVFLYFAATERAWLSWQTLIVYPRAYSGGMFGNVARAWSSAPLVWKYMAFMTPAAVLTVVAALAAGRAAPPRAWLLLAALSIGTFWAVALPGAYHPHYFQLWFMPLSIGAGWGAAALPRLPGLRVPRLATAATALALVVILYPQFTFLGLSGPQRGRLKYGDFFMWGHEAARAAGEALLPGETLYTWSDETYIYPVARRRPPAAALWRHHAATGPLAAWLSERSLADLKRKPPELILHWGNPLWPVDHPIVRWSLEHYAPLPGAERRYFPVFFYVRKGGALERRLASPTTSPSGSDPRDLGVTTRNSPEIPRSTSG